MLERIIVGDLRTNCYFFSFNKKECVIIDPGGDASRIISSVEVLNLVPVGIIFTHGHFDHTLAAAAVRAHFLKKNAKIKIAIHGADRAYLGRNAKRTNLKHFKVLGGAAQAAFEKLFALLPEPDLYLKEGDDVFKSGLKVIETPGHSPGSICLYHKLESVLFTGDTLFFEGIGRSDLPGGNEKALLKSIHEKLMVLPPETNVYPGHGPFTTLERETKGNPYLEMAKK